MVLRASCQGLVLPVIVSVLPASLVAIAAFSCYSSKQLMCGTGLKNSAGQPDGKMPKDVIRESPGSR